MKGLQMFFKVIDPNRFSRSILNLRLASAGEICDPEDRIAERYGDLSFEMLDETLGQWLATHNPPMNPLSARNR
ncbi:MAG: hypothetical protein ABFD98_11745 [Syntrophobacteraceae bacterium]|nr:hypothetical protein [Desulfobacteraceae bacterium]